MTTSPTDLHRPFIARLQLSPPEERAKAQSKEAAQAAYRRRYWRDYAKRVKRVFGTLSPAEHAAAKARAEAEGRSIWGQIWAESQAYRAQTIVPSAQIEANQQRMIADLRRIGDTLTQLARLGHIRADASGGLAPVDGIGREALRHMERLEAAVSRFAADPVSQDHDR